MSTKALTRISEIPSLFNDFFRPWGDWFDDSRLLNRINNIPPVNIMENPDHYHVTLAAPGLKKDDFRIDLDGNMLTISSEKEEKKEVKDEKYTRQEYSYSSFERSFNLPEDVKQEAIEANYEDGVLNIRLPRKDESRKAALSKKISVK